jgi:hypothetical protein
MAEDEKEKCWCELSLTLWDKENPWIWPRINSFKPCIGDKNNRKIYKAYQVNFCPYCGKRMEYICECCGRPING